MVRDGSEDAVEDVEEVEGAGSEGEEVEGTEARELDSEELTVDDGGTNEESSTERETSSV